MDILFVGGTGTISTAVVELALERGYRVFLLNRGQRQNPFKGRTQDIIADKSDAAAVRQAIGGRRFDVVVNFIAYTAADVEADINLFAGQTAHYFLISSASAYQKPPAHYLITESTPLRNPYWQYSRDKIAAEETALRAYRERDFPVTIVRPGYTYCPSRVPGPFSLNFQYFERIRQGKPLLVHGDGQTLWQMTWSGDFAKGFVGLFGQQRAIGDAFHISSDEVLTWDQLYQAMGRALGCDVKLVHVPIEFLERAAPKAFYDSLRGDKVFSQVLDNSKIKTIVPEYRATVSFHEGMCRCRDYLAAHPEAASNVDANAVVERILAQWERVLARSPDGPAFT